MNNQKFYLGIDIGGTNYKFGIVNDTNQIIFRKSVPASANETPENFINTLNSFIDAALQIEPKIYSIGIGLPGIVDENEIFVIAPHLPNLKNLEIGKQIRKKYSLPLAIDNDANAAAIAEMLAGSGICYSSFIYITLGTGVGGAIIINNEIFKGISGGAGEIGHLLIENNDFNEINHKNLPNYRRGILEELIGRNSIINLAKNLLKAAENNNSLLNSTDFLVGNEIDVIDISRAAAVGDKISVQCLAIISKYLGMAIVSVANLLDIPHFIIGGGISQSELLLCETLRFARERALPSLAQRLTVAPAKYLNDTGIIGAALLGKSKLL